MKKGDKVTIIPNENHLEYVKDFYGKELEITEVLLNDKNEKLCKIKGIKNYALESDLKIA